MSGWITDKPPTRGTVYVTLNGEVQEWDFTSVVFEWSEGNRIAWQQVHRKPEPYVAPKPRRREHVIQTKTMMDPDYIAREVLPGDPDPDKAIALIARFRGLRDTYRGVLRLDIDSALMEFDS